MNTTEQVQLRMQVLRGLAAITLFAVVGCGPSADDQTDADPEPAKQYDPLASQKKVMEDARELEAKMQKNKEAMDQAIDDASTGNKIKDDPRDH